MGKPNIVFIQSDSMDGRVMGCMGHSAAYTPNFDRLAGEGVLFANAYCNSPQCCPSRASMWSGKYTHEVEGWNNHKGLAETDRTFRMDLEDHGYEVVTFGKLDYLSGSHSLGNRVNAWTRSTPLRENGKKGGGPKPVVTEAGPQDDHANDWKKVQQSCEWLKGRSGDRKPFMLYCGISLPHPPFVSSREWVNRIDRSKVTVPPQEELTHPVMKYASMSKGCEGPFTEETIVAIRQIYYAMVAETDAMVGKIVDTIRELGMTDNTYVIYASDHGEMNMEHQQILKNSMYEGSARVPLIVSGPGVKQGLVVEELVSLVDIYPTLMDMAGVEKRDDLSGHSLMPETRGDAGTRPYWIFSEYHSNFQNTGSFMVRQGDWKYVAFGGGYEPQLFNLSEDPEEMANLAVRLPEKREQMDALLRGIVDYEAVDAKVKAYDKECFRAWRKQLGEEKYLETMKELNKGWTAEQQEMIEQWLAQGTVAS
jgi:arylsulfatase K